MKYNDDGIDKLIREAKEVLTRKEGKFIPSKYVIPNVNEEEKDESKRDDRTRNVE